ncbi:protein SAMBA isoform X2 [Amaranthus tricolor]|uniref:protein SAMBA isoform X2 n=1 Tax=Amaranthus tricolor TaxID=29722 RepID=UPI0025910D4B|nr:protein SAMBA isoform X2 [Amaranthus tricolor]
MATTPQGTGNNNQNSNNTTPPDVDDFHFASSQLLSVLDSKDDALQVLKSDLMDALNKGIKSLDEDNWMYEGPRSRINLVSKPGGSMALRNMKS